MNAVHTGCAQAGVNASSPDKACLTALQKHTNVHVMRPYRCYAEISAYSWVQLRIY
ncbi:hypothetical protein SCLCIDRAFT_1215129 [Scleroderma citrinum Foug A]|uniref:Uncharacterized protein n=1 Tax=Scleroderma citrinum Foug A TaxID=1036808 RepID=A0A0C2ZLS5_9AGAM|nr:hypothetical protein SCLCIDRAFT_1215129 [Scleroderma citrinum Foug A]